MIIEPNFVGYCESSAGLLRVESDRTAVKSVSFAEKRLEDPSRCEVLDRCLSQLELYFAHQLKHFDVPLAPEGTDFQKQVWQKLIEIPFGTTVSYESIARKLGDSKKTRAVGLSNGKNPIAIIIPCHRVIGANGSLTGYAGGLDKKRWLLDHESNQMQFSL